MRSQWAQRPAWWITWIQTFTSLWKRIWKETKWCLDDKRDSMKKSLSLRLTTAGQIVQLISSHWNNFFLFQLTYNGEPHFLIYYRVTKTLHRNSWDPEMKNCGTWLLMVSGCISDRSQTYNLFIITISGVMLLWAAYAVCGRIACWGIIYIIICMNTPESTLADSSCDIYQDEITHGKDLADHAVELEIKQFISSYTIPHVGRIKFSDRNMDRYVHLS